MNEQEEFYETMNFITAPIRFLIGFIRTFIVLVVLALIGVAYPLILYVSGQSVTLAAFIVSGLTLLFLFTLFYAPYYVVLGGLTVGAVLWGYMIFAQNVPEFLSNFKTVVFVFLILGILQRFLRSHSNGKSTSATSLNLTYEPKPEPVSLVTKCKLEWL